MSGKAAALGGRLMGPVSEQLLKQFVANFSARLSAMAPPQGVPDAPGAAADAAGSATAADEAATPPLYKAAPPAQAAELNGIAFMWAIVRDWLRAHFTRKAQGR